MEARSSEQERIQYRDGKNLNTRISLHQAFSTNSYGFGNWLMDQYRFPKGGKVLELGCGTGSIWQGKEKQLGDLASLMLTDLSEGMVKEAKQNLDFGDKAEFLTANIENLPFASKSFDVVIANMMLYHVRDKEKALSEVRRVMKDGASFYCATFGDYNLVDFLHDTLKGICDIRLPNKSFTLQNGAALLEKYFDTVECRRYADSFAITDSSAVIDYVESLPGIELTEKNREDLFRVLEAKKDKDGVLRVPKDYGTFLAKK